MSDGPLGNPIHLPVTYKDATGALVDATSVVLTITLPDLTTVTPAVTQDSTGKYHVDYTPTQIGRYVWAYTSSNYGGVGDVFNVGPQSSALVSLAAAKLHIQVAATDTDDDAEMRTFLLSATDMVNSSCGYSAPTSVSEYVQCQLSGQATLVLTEWPVLTVTAVTPQLTWAPLITLSDLVASDSGVYTLNSGQLFYGPTLVAYTVGRATVPEDLQELTLLLFKWMWETQRGAGTAGISGFSDEAVAGRFPNPLPFRAEAIMRKYQRPNV